MSSTPILPFAVWQEGINQASIPANDNSLRNQILNGLVISDAVTAQPASPSNGDIYILAATHTGAQWAAFDPDDLVIYSDGTWYAFAPVDGVVVNFEGEQQQWIGSGGWAPIAGGGGGAVAGSDKQVQFNDGGAFGAEAGFEYDKTTNTLTVAKVNESKGSDIASATTTDIGAATGNFVHITGTTTITGFGTVAAGARRLVVFDGALLLTHNATSLILPTGANITTAAGDTATCVSEGSGNWRVTSYQRKDGTALSSSGGGLTNITEALATASPNNTNNVASLTVTGGTTNAYLALVPKANGGLLAAVPDSGTGGGNVRGTRAVDWQQGRSAADKVAAATGSVIGGGDSNKVPSTASYSTIGGGQGNTAGGSTGTHNTVGGGNTNGISATGNYNTISGGSSHTISSSADGSTISGGSSNSITGIGAMIPGGQSNSAAGNYAISFGQAAIGKAITGVLTHASGNLQTNGDAQNERYIVGFRTLNATTTALTTTHGAASAANQPALASGSAMSFIGHVIARNTSTGDMAAWYISGSIKNVGGTTSLVGTPTVTQMGADAGASAWTLAVVADNTNDCLQINATGAASTTIKWVGTIDCSYVV